LLCDNDFPAVDPKVGHLAIFVGTKVAAKDHAEFINNMELSEFGIDPPDITNWQWPFQGIS